MTNTAINTAAAQIKAAGYEGTLINDSNDNGHTGWEFTFATEVEDDAALAVLDILHANVDFDSTYSDFYLGEGPRTVVMIAA